MWALFAAASLAIMLTLVKVLARGVPPTQVLVLRQAVIAFAVLPFAMSRFSSTFMTQRFWQHLLRAMSAGAAMLAGYIAIVHLPLSDFIALSFSRALFVTILAVIILAEVVSSRRWMATLVGFAGVLLIVGPTTESFSPYALLVLFGAFATALVYILVRSLTETEASLTILSYQAGLVGLLVLPLAAMEWVPLSPTQWILAIAIGLTGLFSQLASIQALKIAPASLLAPYDYTRIIWAVALGYLLFSEVPTLQAGFGTILIVVAGWISYAENGSRKAGTQPEP